MANRILITNGEDLPAPLRQKRLGLSDKVFEKILVLTLKNLKQSTEYKAYSKLLGTPKTLELHFCDDKEMRSFQKKFRKLDRTTDVLSFPSLEAPENIEKGFLGSIVISLPTVMRNAKRYKHSESKELAEVFIHGILHLLGFDHIRVSENRKVRMRKVQESILNQIKL